MRPSTDVIIIGAGIIGCAIGYELAKHGRSVLVIERNQIGSEASSAAAGMLSAQLSHAEGNLSPSFFHLLLEGRALFPATVAELERETGVDIGFKETGLLYLFFSKNHLRTTQPRIRWQQKHSLSVEWLGPHQVRQKEPPIDRSIMGAYYFPKDSQVDNVSLTRAYAQAARKRGVRFLQGQAVSRVLIEKGKVVGARTTSERTYYATTVVNACGAWAGFGRSLPFHIPVFPVKGQILTFQFRKLPFQTPVVSPDAAYCVPRESNRLLVGTTAEFHRSDKKMTRKGIRQILSSVSKFTSCLEGHKVYEQWAGLRPCTPDYLPILGKTPVKGLYIATGHFRDGILLAPITAHLMTELITREKTSISLKPFSLARFL
jgi:glycine oxidase